MKTILLALLLLAADTKAVSIHLSSNVMFAGSDLVVTCTVPRHEKNRTIEAALLPYSVSSRQLNGADAPITHRFTFLHVPEDVTEARCVLTDAYGAHYTATQALQVVSTR